MKIIRLAAKRWKLVLFILIVLGGILFFVFRNSNKEIKTTEIQKGKISEELVLSGSVNASNYAKLSFESSGKIVYIGVTEGDFVNKGKLLSKLDTTVLNSNYQIAQANLRLYQATVENVYNQVKDHTGDETFAQKDLRTTAEVNKDKAYEGVIAAKRNLDGASLYAPFTGYVTYLAHPFTQVFASVGQTEAELIDPTTIYFDVVADQTEVIKLSVGQKVEIVIDPFTDKTFEGRIDRISFTPKVGESGSVYSVKVEFTGIKLNDSRFKIAMTGDAKFVISEKENTLFVPANFIKQDKTGSYLKTDEKKGKVYINTGIESEENVEVIGAISEGQLIYD